MQQKRKFTMNLQDPHGLRFGTRKFQKRRLAYIDQSNFATTCRGGMVSFLLIWRVMGLCNIKIQSEERTMVLTSVR